VLVENDKMKDIRRGPRKGLSTDRSQKKGSKKMKAGVLHRADPEQSKGGGERNFCWGGNRLCPERGIGEPERHGGWGKEKKNEGAGSPPRLQRKNTKRAVGKK